MKLIIFNLIPNKDVKTLQFKLPLEEYMTLLRWQLQVSCSPQLKPGTKAHSLMLISWGFVCLYVWVVLLLFFVLANISSAKLFANQKWLKSQILASTRN